MQLETGYDRKVDLCGVGRSVQDCLMLVVIADCARTTVFDQWRIADCVTRPVLEKVYS